MLEENEERVIEDQCQQNVEPIVDEDNDWLMKIWITNFGII